MIFVNRFKTQDPEWDSFINILNQWTDEGRQLRSIVQQIRSGEFYPADCYVDLIEQFRLKAKPRLQTVCPKCRQKGFSGLFLAHKPDCPDKDFQ